MATEWESFRDAVVVLTGPGPVKQRLAEAYLRHLSEIEPEALPRDARAEFVALCALLRSMPRTGGLNPVAASVLKMSETDAARHAQSIVSIFAALHEQHPSLPASRSAAVLRAVPNDDVPAFLNRA